LSVSPTIVLSELLSRPEGCWTLAEGAVAVARLGGATISPSVLDKRLDSMAEVIHAEIAHARHPRFVAAGLARGLFDRLDFSIAGPEHSSPDLRFIDQALACRLAAPSLMALLAIELGRRCGVRVEGTGLPGRLVLRIRCGDQAAFVDTSPHFPVMNSEQLQQRAHHATAGRISFREDGLPVISASQVLARLLRDLKDVYWQQEDLLRTLESVEMILAIRPDDPREIRDRGRLLFMLGRHEEAARQLEMYLTVNPRGQDAEAIRLILQEARSGRHSQHS